jgi:hypothetical protein
MTSTEQETARIRALLAEIHVLEDLVRRAVRERSDPGLLKLVLADMEALKRASKVR